MARITGWYFNLRDPAHLPLAWPVDRRIDLQQQLTTSEMRFWLTSGRSSALRPERFAKPLTCLVIEFGPGCVKTWIQKNVEDYIVKDSAIRVVDASIETTHLKLIE